MPLSTVSVSLVGGPPWGFRIAEQDGELPMVSQVLPEGRADKEGIRPGDIIDGVNGEDCAFAEQIHNKMRTAQGVLRLRLKRPDRPTHYLPALPKLTLLPETETVSTPESSAPPTPSSGVSSSRLNAAAKPPLQSYNGGMKGSTQDKKRFFEAAIARQNQLSPSPRRDPHRKSAYGATLSVSSGPPSESGTDISGYDSVAGDFYCNGYDRQCPITSSYISENCWYTPRASIDYSVGSKTPTLFDSGQGTREESATPLPIDNDSNKGLNGSPLPFAWKNTTDGHVLEENSYHNDQIMHDASTDSGLASSTSLPPPPPPPSTMSALNPSNGKKWNIRVEDASSKATPVITSSVKTGHASGEVEVPRPQSVAELRSQLVTKLEVRNPAGQKTAPLDPGQNRDATFTPATPAIVHQPARPQHGRLTPSVSLLSLDKVLSNNNFDGPSSTNTSPMASTSNRQFYADYSPSYFTGYDRGRSPSFFNDAASNYDGMYSSNSTLRRQHSQLFTQPEIQHAVLLHPGSDSSPKQRPIQSSISMQNLSQPYFYPQKHEQETTAHANNQTPDLSPPAAPFSTQPPQAATLYSNGQPMSFAEECQQVQNSKNQDQSDTPRTEKHKFDTPLLSALAANGDCEGRESRERTQLPSPFTGNKFNVNEEQKFNIGKIQVVAQTDIESPTPHQNAQQPALDQASSSAPSRLTELIELARKSFNDDTGRQLVDFIWSQPSNDQNPTYLRNKRQSSQRPHSVYELNSGPNMNGYATLPSRGSRSTTARKQYTDGTASDADDGSPSEKTTWYKQMYNTCRPSMQPDMERTINYRVEQVDMSNQRATTPQSRLEQQNQEQLLLEQQQRRAKSVGRYDPVADMEILDHFSRQKAQFMREQNGQPIRAMEALQISCNPAMARQTQSPASNAAPKKAAASAGNNSYAITRSQTQHFHLPSYRFVHEDPRPILSPNSCMRCGKDRRDYSWKEIEDLYDMMDKKELGEEIKRDKLSERIKIRFMESRLDETAQDLQKVIDQLESFGKTRSKSNPELAWKLRNSRGKFSYLTGQQPSTSKAGFLPNGHGREMSPNPLSRGINEMKKMTMEEVLHRQRAEKLSEELDDQRSRRHGYFPGASPALQNNVQRFDHLLHNNVGPTPNNIEFNSSRSSTPARIRGNSANVVQTCTVLYKFVAQGPRELSLNRGDVVRVHREIDSNWIEGERNGNVGIFPASYVQMDEDPSTSRNRVRAVYPFQARNRNELSLKRGEILRKRREIDANWIEGTNSKGQIGIFPKCYVQPQVEGADNGDDDASSVIPDRPKTPKIAATTQSSRAVSPLPSKKEINRSHQIQQWEQRQGDSGFSGPAKMVPKNSETYRALYSYKPEHPDELNLQENDIVFVVEKCDDGWFIGTLLRTGQFGTFPGNYVEKH